MNEQLSGLAEPALRRLLANPAPMRCSYSSKIKAESIRAAVSAADAAQIMIFGLALRPLFPAAVEAFSFWQMFDLVTLGAGLAIAVRRSFRIPGRHPFMVLAPATATLLAVFSEASIYWIILSQTTTPSSDGSIAWFVTWAVTAACGSAAIRYTANWATASLKSGHNIVVVGSPEQVEPVAHSVEVMSGSLWRLVGRFDDREPGVLDELADAVARRNVDVVVLALTGSDAGPRLAAVCRRLADQPIRVCLTLDSVVLRGIPRAGTCIGPCIGSLPLVDILTDPHGGLSGIAKRWIDIAISILALVLFMPLLVAAAMAIKFESPGPIIFRQWRFGLGSQPIQVLKLRTMFREAGDPTGGLRTVARDQRVTKVGRILRFMSIDELPQLINVLRGTMSLVGPRPHPLHMRVGDQYYFETVPHYRNRHIVKPGITGWAQINGSRGEVDTLEEAERRVALDLWYLEKWSLWLDLRILLITAMGGFLNFGTDWAHSYQRGKSTAKPYH